MTELITSANDHRIKTEIDGTIVNCTFRMGIIKMEKLYAGFTEQEARERFLKELKEKFEI